VEGEGSDQRRRPSTKHLCRRRNEAALESLTSSVKEKRKREARRLPVEEPEAAHAAGPAHRRPA
jgi:hypothetical protein